MKKQKTIKGMYWHCHHDKICEYVYDYQERVDYINKYKPKNEVETRLKLFKPVKVKLPKEYLEVLKKYLEAGKKCAEAGKKYDKAWEKWDEAGKKCDEAGEKYDKAWEKYDKAWEKWDEAGEKYKSQLEELHKKDCGCSKWNGKEIVFK